LTNAAANVQEVCTLRVDCSSTHVCSSYSAVRVRPRLNRVTFMPARKHGVDEVRPDKRVPPRITIRIATFAASARTGVGRWAMQLASAQPSSPAHSVGVCQAMQAVEH
jgi:hypothetical protein